MNADQKKYLSLLIKELEKLSLKCVLKDQTLFINSGIKTIELNFSEQQHNHSLNIPFDHIVTQSKKIVPVVLSKLNLNKTVYARNCIVQKIDKKTAEDFLNAYHLMNNSGSSFNYGLFYKDELIGAASFSKGRKMNRLPEGKQSFELIRFCCKSGLTITGGLSKLMKTFYDEKKAGDIMTYVDKQFSNGDSFIKAGFKKHSETPPLYFLINKKTFERALLKDKHENFDEKLFYRTQNSGNIKMIYTPKLK